MRQIMLSFSLMLMMVFSLQAQQFVCGNHPGAEGFQIKRNRLIHNLRMVAEGGSATARDISYVPIRFHIGAKSDGSGRRSEMLILDQLCELNEDFAPYDIQFFLADNGFNYINNTTFFENHAVTQNSVMEQQRDQRALNVFIVESADTDPNNGNGSVLAYYQTQRDWIVITDNFVDDDGITLTHEIGHFFALDHTFLGWESEGYNIENDPAPSISSGGQVPTERVNGTNCENAADLICDTPPDFNNGIGWSGCDFTLNVLDPLGAAIDPDERNYMSYFLSCPDLEYHFSDQQNEVIQFDLNSNFRNYLRIDPVPEVLAVEGTSSAIYPVGNEQVADDDQVYLSWTAATNATAYVLEVSRLTSFNVNPIRMVVYGTNRVIDGLEAGKKYYWRVRPFNAHDGCAANSSTESFTTNALVATRDLAFVDNFRVSPNPVSGQNSLTLQLNSQEAFNGQIQLIDMTGRPVSQGLKFDFATGEQQINVPLNNLSNGIYLLKLITTQGQLTRKVVVTN